MSVRGETLFCLRKVTWSIPLLHDPMVIAANLDIGEKGVENPGVCPGVLNLKVTFVLPEAAVHETQVDV